MDSVWGVMLFTGICILFSPPHHPLLLFSVITAADDSLQQLYSHLY